MERTNEVPEPPIQRSSARKPVKKKPVKKTPTRRSLNERITESQKSNPTPTEKDLAAAQAALRFLNDFRAKHGLPAPE